MGLTGESNGGTEREQSLLRENARLRAALENISDEYPDVWLAGRLARTAMGELWRGVYPGMCIDPEICRGKTHCPRNYSCCE